MSRSSSRQQIGNAVIRAIEKSFEVHYAMSEDWLDYAPEYFVSVRIAEELAKKAHKSYVTMEYPVRDCINDADIAIRGRPHRELRRNGRFDVVLWWRSTERPRAAIEVKHPVWSDPSLLDADAKRLCRVLADGKGLQFAMLAYYCSSEKPRRKHTSATARIKARAQRIERRIRSIAKGLHCRAEFHRGNIRRFDGEAWTARCVRFDKY